MLSNQDIFFLQLGQIDLPFDILIPLGIRQVSAATYEPIISPKTVTKNISNIC